MHTRVIWRPGERKFKKTAQRRLRKRDMWRLISLRTTKVSCNHLWLIFFLNASSQSQSHITHSYQNQKVKKCTIYTSIHLYDPPPLLRTKTSLQIFFKLKKWKNRPFYRKIPLISFFFRILKIFQQQHYVVIQRGRRRVVKTWWWWWWWEEIQENTHLAYGYVKIQRFRSLRIVFENFFF